MNRVIRLFFAAPLVGFVSVASLACSSANGPSLDPAKSNCNIVCEQVAKCDPSDSFNVDTCETKCDDKSSDDTYKASVTDCATCVNGKSCSDAAGCAGNCLSTVTSS